MLTKIMNGKNLEFDTDGNLTDHTTWDEEIAVLLAEEVEISERTENHWKVINFFRKEYDSSCAAPTLRKTGKQSGVNIKELYSLFPDGPMKKVAKIAGLPKPKSCI